MGLRRLLTCPDPSSAHSHVGRSLSPSCPSPHLQTGPDSVGREDSPARRPFQGCRPSPEALGVLVVRGQVATLGLQDPGDSPGTGDPGDQVGMGILGGLPGQVGPEHLAPLSAPSGRPGNKQNTGLGLGWGPTHPARVSRCALQSPRLGCFPQWTRRVDACWHRVLGTKEARAQRGFIRAHQ